MLSVNLQINEHVNLIELTLKSFRKCVLIKQTERMIMGKILILSWTSSQCRSTKLKIIHNWFSFSISVAGIPHGSRPFRILSNQQQMCRCGPHVLYSHNKYPAYTRFKLESESIFSWILYLNNSHATHKRSRLH
jgi:hypothetical protein